MQQITHWTDLGLTLPPALVKAIGVYDAIRYAQVEHPPVFDPTGVTAKNAEDRLFSFADDLAKAAVINDAKRYALAAAAREVTTQAGAAVPDVIAQLTPAFERSASAFAAAVAGLPDELTSEQLVAAGPSTVELYQTAREAAQHIAAVDSWLAGLVNLPHYAGLPHEPCLRVVSPKDRVELITLLDAHEAQHIDPMVQALGSVYVAAVRAGIAFGINDPRQQAALREQIEAAPVERQRRRVTIA